MAFLASPCAPHFGDRRSARDSPLVQPNRSRGNDHAYHRQPRRAGQCRDLGSARNQSPASCTDLAGLQLTVSDGKLSVAGFDYDIVARSVVTGDDATAGTILVNGAELAAAVKAMPKSKTARAELTVTYPGPVAGPVTEDGRGPELARDMPPILAISCDGITSQLAGMPTDEYPALPELPELAGTFAADDFARAFTRVAAAAGEMTRCPCSHACKCSSPKHP